MADEQEGGAAARGNGAVSHGDSPHSDPAHGDPANGQPANGQPVNGQPVQGRIPRSIGKAVLSLKDVPQEIKSAAQHRFGTDLRMGVPRANGLYKGEVLNTEHYVVQEVAARSVVFHPKAQLAIISESLAWRDKNQRLNGADVQIGYDEHGRPKMFPFDRQRDNLEKTIGALKKSAQELEMGEDVLQTLDTLKTHTWERTKALRKERAEELAKEQAAQQAPGQDQGQEAGQEQAQGQDAGQAVQQGQDAQNRAAGQELPQEQTLGQDGSQDQNHAAEHAAQAQPAFDPDPPVPPEKPSRRARRAPSKSRSLER